MERKERRREEKEAAREKVFLDAISAADALKKGGGASKDSDDKKNKKKKKKPEDGDEPVTNGKKPDVIKDDSNDDDEDDDESYDSIDEEEEYYQEQLGEVDGRLLIEKLPREGEEDDDTLLLLRDLVRPLEAWDFHLTGKAGLEVHETESDDGEVDEDEEELDNKVPKPEENGNLEDDLFSGDIEGFDGRNADDVEIMKAPTKRKSAPSPAPNNSKEDI